MQAYTVVTNNAALQAGGVAGLDLAPVTGGLEAVYDALSRMLQSGYRLVSSPLPANVPLIRSPVRSVIVQKTDRRFDVPGLLALERARERSQTLGVNAEARLRGDLELIDKDQFHRAVAQLKAFDEATAAGACQSV